MWLEKSEIKQISKSKSKKSQAAADDDDSIIGPAQRNTAGLSTKDFGHALLPGEGAAMVSYTSQWFFIQTADINALFSF